jgi:tyrocidine synthetase III
MKEILDLLSALKQKGTRLLLSDTGNGFVVRGNISSISDDEKNKLKQYREEITALLKKADPAAMTPIPAAPPAASYALSSAQKRLWLLSQFEKGSGAYNVYTNSIFEGNLSYEVLLLSLNKLIMRHEILRTVFAEDETGEIRQYVLQEGNCAVSCRRVDIRAQNIVPGYADKLLTEEINQPFDLTAGPLFRACLLQTDDDKWIFCCVMHHIICDAWSIDILIKELLQYYAAFSGGADPALSPLRIQYKDYAAWQQQQLQSGAYNNHKQYWLNKFEGELPALDLPADKLRPAVKTYGAGVVSKKTDALLSMRAKALFKQHDCTFFMGFLALVNALLYRYTGQDDIISGSPVAGREHPDLGSQAGFYVNTLALRTKFSGNHSYAQLLEEIKVVTLEAYEHQAYPFDELVDALNIKRDVSRNNLFDTMVVLHHNNRDTEAIHLNGLAIKRYPGLQFGQSGKFDLVFHFTVAEEIEINLEYNSDIYTHATAERMARHLTDLLKAVVADPSAALNKIDYLDEAEKQLLLHHFNDTELQYPADKTVVKLLEDTVKINPGNTAVVFENRSTTYGTLNEKANRLSSYLKQRYQIGQEDIVGIKLQRGVELIIAILAVLKAGGAYMPIDPDYPEERIEYMLKDSGCKVLIDKSEMHFFEETANSWSSSNPAQAAGNSNLAYVVYTSGSTGNPKGIMVEHKMLLNLCSWHNVRFGVTAKDRTTLYAGVGFDAAVWEIFPALVAGACLYVVPEDIRFNAAAIAAYYDKNAITISFLPTQMAEQFMTMENQSLRYLLTGGDKMSCYQKQQYSIINNYGPTENTVVTTSDEITEQVSNIPIGRPVSNVQVYIVDNAGMLCPVGVVGEICVAGKSLARGYLNRPELTAEKFVANPFSAGERLYLTGDLGRWLPDGKIEFAGRKDEQLKIRGYRIEPGEIESRLKKHDAVEEAFVTAVANKYGEKELAAYIKCDAATTVAELRAYLAQTLPANMIPGHFVYMKELPVTQNGKVDKKMLPDPAQAAMQSGTEQISPRNETEKKLAEIWAELLDKQDISVKDDFFALGGHSLKAAKLVSRIYKVFGVKISFEKLFITTILEEQATLIDGAAKASFAAIPRVAEQQAYPVSAAQQRLWVLSRFEEGSLAYNMPGMYIFEGALNFKALEYAFAALIQRHEILRTVFREDESGVVKQFILPAEEAVFNITYNNLCAENDAEKKLQVLAKEILSRPFALESLPPLRAALFQIREDKFVFVYVMHHIISDGWSMGILVNELFTFYQAYFNPGLNLPAPLPVQYKDYAAWQQQQLQEGLMEEHKQYWLQQFRGELPVLELWGGNTRPAARTYNGHTVKSSISREIAGHFRALCRQQGATLFMGLAAVVNTLLYRYTGQEDIITGTPAAGREHPDLEAHWHYEPGFPDRKTLSPCLKK